MPRPADASFGLASHDAASPAGGIVRGARRPPGWVAPGPRPATATPTPELWPGPDEDLCWLSGDWRILQRTDGHRFSLDDLVTAHLAAQLLAHRPPRRALDLGCGIGSVLMFVAWSFPDATCVGLEAQAVSAAMARRSLRWNGADGRCVVEDGDLRDGAALADQAPFDLVTGTPPYFPRGTGLESDHVQRGPCRFEHRGGVEAYCEAAARHLGPGAPFVACAPSNQRARVEAAGAAAGLALVRWRDVVPRAGKAPLVSVFAFRRATEATADEPFALQEDPPLVVRDAHGQRTPEFRAVRLDVGMPP